MKKLFILAALAVLVNACVTEKKRKDVSKTKKLYHDITAEFNGYFNATELYDASVATLSDQEPENYGKLLPVYPYVAVENPAVVAADMDEAIKKVTIVAALHDPSHWVDDCYLLAGKAQYLKQDYESAEETLEYLVREFSPEAVLENQKKKDRAKPKTKKERNKASKEKAKKRDEVKKEKEKTAAQKRKEYKKRRKQKNREIAQRRKAQKKGKAVPKKPEAVTETPAPVVEEPKDTPKEEVADETNKDIDLDEPDGPFKHKSAHQAGQLWLARTYIQRDKHEQAAYLLRQLKNKDNLYAEVARELPVVEAHLAFVQKRYNDGIAPLEQAVAVAEEKADRARYTYILAQLQEQNGNNAAAYALYEDVVKMRPDYEMEFSALMSMLLNQYNSGSSGREETIKSLEKLTKDEKNIDYLDRIYFAIAEIHLQSGNEAEGVKYLELALKQGTTNPAQQAESFLKLANVYYEKEEYVKASDYYRQAISGISKNDDRYEEIEKRSRVLGEIATRINKITLQDSLIRVGNMTPDEKRALAFEIKKRQDEERRQQAIASAKEQDSKPLRRPRVTATGNTLNPVSKSNYWAYDDRNVKRGKRDFSRQWGSRPLTDDWRRRSAQQVSDIEAGDEDDLDLDNSGLLSDEQVANILRGVPQSKSQIQAAEADKYLAMFELGVLYRKDLERLDKAILTLEQLLREYPTTEKKAEAYYHLYLAHKDSGNSSNANRYLERLKSEFPDSPFTKILSDPNYAQKVEDEKHQLDRFYTETYDLFSDEKYQEAHNRIQQVPSKFGEDNELKARFALLEAMTTGNLQGREAYIRKLREVITKHPNTDEQKRAREILLLLGERSGSPLPGGGNNVANNGEFKYEPEKLHYLLVVLDPDVTLTDAKVKIAEFNRKYHASDNLRVSNIYLTPKNAPRVPLIVMRRFKDGAAAMQYYKNVQLNSGDFFSDSDYLVYPVTQENYRQIMRTKSVETYDAFFEQNYLNSK